MGSAAAGGRRTVVVFIVVVFVVFFVVVFIVFIVFVDAALGDALPAWWAPGLDVEGVIGLGEGVAAGHAEAEADGGRPLFAAAPKQLDELEHLRLALLGVTELLLEVAQGVLGLLRPRHSLGLFFDEAAQGLLHVVNDVH